MRLIETAMGLSIAALMIAGMMMFYSQASQAKKAQDEKLGFKGRVEIQFKSE